MPSATIELSFAARLAQTELSASEISKRTRVPLRTVYAWLARTNEPTEYAQRAILGLLSARPKKSA